MDGTTRAAIEQFKDDVFEFLRTRQLVEIAEQSFFAAVKHGDDEQSCNRKWDEQTERKGPAIEAHSKLLKSGESLAPLLADHPAAARGLTTFLHFLDWRTFKVKAGLEHWDNLAIELNLALNLKPALPSVQPPKLSIPLIVDVKQLTATVTATGKIFSLKKEADARWLKVLIDCPGNWVSGSALENLDPELMGVRTDRMHKRLPAPVKKLVEQKRGDGARIKLA